MIRTTAMAVLLAAALNVNAAEDAAAVDPAKGQEIAETVCIACHGADGNSPDPANPRIAGLGADYLYKQLTNFKMPDDGERPALRESAIMNSMVAGLSLEDMKNLAAYFSVQKFDPAEAESEAAQLALGQKIWRQGDFAKGIPACAGCHGPAGAGMPAQYPRLAGQFYEYTEDQLKKFRSGERGNDPEKMMQTIADKMSDRQIEAVAKYATGLR